MTAKFTIATPRQYLTDFAWVEKHELAFYVRMDRLSEVIANAVQGRVPVSEYAPRGIHSHWLGRANRHWHPDKPNQRRLALTLARRVRRLRCANNFHQLWLEVCMAASDGPDPAISAAGAEQSVILFDVAVFIGARLGHRPEVVYLHAGARRGAELLLGKEAVRGRRTIQLEELPTAWQILDDLQAETALCAYKPWA